MGPLNPSSKGNTYILTAKDCFTRWLEAFPTKSTSTATVVTVLVREVFSRWGFPTHLHSDRGSGFTSENMREIIKALGIRQTHTPAYNPQSNSVERAHKDLGRALRASYGNGKRDWEECLPVALQALRTARCSATGFTPQFLMTGQEQQMPLDLIYGAPPEEPQTAVNHLKNLRETFRETYEFCREKLGLTFARASQEYEGPELDIQPGRRVWLFTPRSRHKGLAKKLQPRWTGPWNVTERISEVLVRIKREEKEFVCGIDRLALIPEKQVITRESWDEDLKWEDFLIQDEFMEYDESYEDSASIPKLLHSEVEAPEVDENQYSPPGGEARVKSTPESESGFLPGPSDPPAESDSDRHDEGPDGNLHEEVGEADFEQNAANNGLSNRPPSNHSESPPTPSLPSDATFDEESFTEPPLPEDATFEDAEGVGPTSFRDRTNASRHTNVPEEVSEDEEEISRDRSRQLADDHQDLSWDDFAESPTPSRSSKTSAPRTPSPPSRESSPGAPQHSSSPKKKVSTRARRPFAKQNDTPESSKRGGSKADLARLEDLEKRLLPSRKPKQNRYKVPGHPKKRGRPPKALTKSIDPVEPKEGRYGPADEEDNFDDIPEDGEALFEHDATMNNLPVSNREDEDWEPEGQRPRGRHGNRNREHDEISTGKGKASKVREARTTRRNPEKPKTTTNLKKKLLKVRAFLGSDPITDLVTKDPVISRRGELRREQESVKKKSSKRSQPK